MSTHRPGPGAVPQGSDDAVSTRAEDDDILGVLIDDAAFEEMMKQKAKFGHQVQKDRGTAQTDLLDIMEAGDNELASYIQNIREWARTRARGGEIINDFLRLIMFNA